MDLFAIGLMRSTVVPVLVMSNAGKEVVHTVIFLPTLALLRNVVQMQTVMDVMVRSAENCNYLLFYASSVPHSSLLV